MIGLEPINTSCSLCTEYPARAAGESEADLSKGMWKYAAIPEIPSFRYFAQVLDDKFTDQIEEKKRNKPANYLDDLCDASARDM